MLTHTTVVKHVLADNVDLRRCTWTVRSTEVGTIADPSVEVDDAVNKDLGPIDTFGDLTRGYTPRGGIGEKASTGRGQGADQLVVLKHGVVVAVTVQIHGNSDDDPANESIARFAIVGI